jgi:hypothetical protein
MPYLWAGDLPASPGLPTLRRVLSIRQGSANRIASLHRLAIPTRSSGRSTSRLPGACSLTA